MQEGKKITQQENFSFLLYLYKIGCVWSDMMSTRTNLGKTKINFVSVNNCITWFFIGLLSLQIIAYKKAKGC